MHANFDKIKTISVYDDKSVIKNVLKFFPEFSNSIKIKFEFQHQLYSARRKKFSTMKNKNFGQISAKK